MFYWKEEDLKVIQKKLAFFGKKININWGSLVKEKNLINGIKKYVLPDMGIQSEDVSFEVIEY